jgi:hypothetical protein
MMYCSVGSLKSSETHPMTLDVSGSVSGGAPTSTQIVMQEVDCK